MDRSEAILHPSNDLALCQDQDDRTGEDEAKERKESDDEL
jgi:hypothetical protein